MKRLLEIVPFYSLDEALEYLENGGDLLPLHHVWCYDQFKKEGYEVLFIENKPSGILGKIGKFIKIDNLQQQLQVIRRAKEYDVIFDPFMQFTFLIALFKIFYLFKKPILTIAQRAYVVNKKNPLKRARQYLTRYVYFKGIDKIVFINQSIFIESKKHKIEGNTDYLRFWGVDHYFFQNYNRAQVEPPHLDFIYSTGGSGRDYNTLLKSFKNINFDLHITARPNFESELKTEIPSNVYVDNSIIPGLTSTGQLREEYYNCLAVAIPLEETSSFSPFGSTVVFEAMAAGKAIIATDNKAYPFNIEKEGIGILVDYYDETGWEKAINFLINNPQKAKEMGEKGQRLSCDIYNYSAFSNEILTHADTLIKKFNFRVHSNK
ncbi:glycosyltransferase involved in cell wall biosynthesis [Gillisia sp. Hel_I_86]|uniref:glycosyltransferase family 4 protein n=1 Tax=Gillisia sp. Hel_I_86 TaxID=1249981 RepID=UPI0011996B1B|nr:glycosyltransferase [Gillisia sp. Hel_I_86]TVZ27523.1 glycosyltransferase involved in cell wall biosynthesis [Gillisia sp. Hel_I_86]